MSGLLILVIAFAVLLIGYLAYGRWLARTWGVDPKQPTPAHSMYDGVDYVPAKRSIVFGHQFASIAGAGPINGPIIAAMFGWVPVLIWILVGGIFFGAVQDFAALYASVKNKGKSIGYVIELYIGKTGKRLFLIFVWLFAILVVAAFADIVAVTFNGFTKEGANVASNGAVATTSTLFCFIAVAFGLWLRKANPNAYVSAAVAIIIVIACVVLGINFPIYFEREIWLYLVFFYVFMASITPIWILMQPRDYLNTFLLVAMIIAAFVGVIVSNPAIELAPFNGFEVNGQFIFPILFVTVACGAISGFHSLVSSNTASKQISNERDMLPIGFGGMLVESLLAVIALIAVGSLAVGNQMPGGSPPAIFAQAVANFLDALHVPRELSFTLMTLAISAFALTSLDAVARIGRMAWQEFFTDSEVSAKGIGAVLGNRYLATLVTLIMGYLLAKRGYMDIWPLFGSANQLLAALALLACAVFLKRTKRKSKMLYIPTAAMLVITLSALAITVQKLVGKISAGTFLPASDGLQLVFAVLLGALGIIVAIAGTRRLREDVPAEAA